MSEIRTSQLKINSDPIVGTIRKEDAVPCKLTQEAVDQLCSCIIQKHLWATPEETAEWLKTDTGKRMQASIDKLRKERRKTA